MTPIDPRQQVTELRRRDRHSTIGGARPQKTTSFELFTKQARALPIMPDDLQQIATPAAKAEQMTTQRIVPKHFLDLQG